MAGQRVAVVGVGAIGGAVAADLGERDHTLALCARTRFDRLVTAHPGGRSTLRAPVFDEPDAARAWAAGGLDWVLLATKAHQTPAAKPWLDALCASGTPLAVLQNGVDHLERTRPLLPAGTGILPVVVQLPAERVAPGRIEQSRDGVLIVPAGARGRAFAALFAGARTRVLVREDFAEQAWWKLLSNAALGGVCALALRPNGAVAKSEARELVLALMREVAAVARAEGAALPADAPEKVLARVSEAAPEHWSSIAVDRREGRALEWQARNAVVGRLGRRHGIATPLNDALTALLALADPGARE